MSRKKRDLIVMAAILVAGAIILISYECLSKNMNVASSSNAIAEESISESTYSDKIDDGPVKVGEEIKIDQPETSDDSIKMEVNSDMSDFKSNAGKAEAGGLVVPKDSSIQNKIEIKADVDWSDYEINDSELREMLSIAARLVEIEMNDSGKYGIVEITAALPSVEELKEFTAPIYYSVSEDGILTLNAKLEITNKSESTYKEVLTPISVYYEGNVVKLKK